MFGTRSKINRQRNGLVRFRFSPYRGNEWRPYTPSVARSATRRNFFATVVYVYVSCTQAREEESPGSFTQTGNMNKEEGNGYPRFFSSPHYYWNSRIYLEFSRGRGGKGRTLCLHDSRFLPIFNIFENFLAPFIFSYIRYSSHLYRSTIAFASILKKITFLLSFFFFFLLIHHLIDFCYYPSRIFFDRGRKLGGKVYERENYIRFDNCK